MRYFIACVALLLIYTGCSTTETIQEDAEPTEPSIEQKTIPNWYSDGVHFSSDSAGIHGYSLASATDSSGAIEFSSETAINYLRIGIDRELEEIREELAEERGSNYHSPSFIIKLRNVISELPLDAANLTFQHETSGDGIHYSYAKATLLRSDLNALLRRHLEDERFIEHASQSSL